MNTLPNEIIILIFELISKITDKRHFLRTCILYNNITKVSMYEYEIPDFYGKLKYSVQKFTLELFHDGYFGLIPKCYITPTNISLVKCLTYYDNVPLFLIELAEEKKCIIRVGNNIYRAHIFLDVDMIGINECGHVLIWHKMVIYQY